MKGGGGYSYSYRRWFTPEATKERAEETRGLYYS